MIKKQFTLASLLLISGFSGTVMAGQGHMSQPMSHHDSDDSKYQAANISAVGVKGDPEEVNRTIYMVLSDAMKFAPSKIMVNSGETVRFFISNTGQIPHEFVIGDKKSMQAHAKMMRDMPNMKHDESNMVSLQPGQKSAIVWKFTQAGTVDFACLVPGHLEAGMTGEIMVH
ncbi:cupredoxin domain-containing protein [Litoribrevibacter albus]|uniref:Blue (type 1) copper domain-containing protein n=1 Tax=Litoribrevibacter albus TaxID=1473156 RepID=A0AA37S8K0_9GAMM|nr:cupredoxin family protein [Litoribrevibacter albus]GLQ30260.1 hypothetical protein GCM10007876_07380 [Litoribrevibacter albus]